MTLASLALALAAGMLSVLSPCVLPILPIVLGAAASERKWGPVALAIGLSISFVAICLFAFGLGAALPLLALGLLSREAMVRWRHRLASASKGAKAGLGALFVAIGVLVLTSLDKSIETALVEASPQWLTDLTTRF